MNGVIFWFFFTTGAQSAAVFLCVPVLSLWIGDIAWRSYTAPNSTERPLSAALCKAKLKILEYYEKLLKNKDNLKYLNDLKWLLDLKSFIPSPPSIPRLQITEGSFIGWTMNISIPHPLATIICAFYLWSILWLTQSYLTYLGWIWKNCIL